MHAPTLEPGAEPARPVHILFVGAGAVGCFYASRLHHPDHHVLTSLIARSNYAALALGGVTLQTHSFGNYTFRPHAVYPSVAAAAAAFADRDGAAASVLSSHASPPQLSSAVAPPTAASSAPPTAEPTHLPFPGTTHHWEYIVVTTKALPDRSDDSQLIEPLVGPRSCIVLIQNGVGVEAPYRARFPTTPIVSAVTLVSAEQLSPGVIRQSRWTRLYLGPYSCDGNMKGASGGSDGGGASIQSRYPENQDNKPDSSQAAMINRLDLTARGLACARRLAGFFTALGGIRDVEVLDDELGLQAVRWHKLCINAAFNPSAVLAGGRGNADMTADPELRTHLAGVMQEICNAAPRVLGRPFPEAMAGPDKILRSTERNADGRPSMLLDWEAGRPMEIEVILGNPLRMARESGVEMPRLQALYALLRSAQGERDRTRERENARARARARGGKGGKL